MSPLFYLSFPLHPLSMHITVQCHAAHAGGRGVIDAIQKELGLSNEFVEPSRAALYRYGNVSSSSVWCVSLR